MMNTDNTISIRDFFNSFRQAVNKNRVMSVNVEEFLLKLQYAIPSRALNHKGLLLEESGTTKANVIHLHIQDLLYMNVVLLAHILQTAPGQFFMVTTVGRPNCAQHDVHSLFAASYNGPNYLPLPSFQNEFFSRTGFGAHGYFQPAPTFQQAGMPQAAGQHFAHPARYSSFGDVGRRTPDYNQSFSLKANRPIEELLKDLSGEADYGRTVQLEDVGVTQEYDGAFTYFVKYVDREGTSYIDNVPLTIGALTLMLKQAQSANCNFFVAVKSDSTSVEKKEVVTLPYKFSIEAILDTLNETEDASTRIEFNDNYLPKTTRNQVGEKDLVFGYIHGVENREGITYLFDKELTVGTMKIILQVLKNNGLEYYTVV